MRMRRMLLLGTMALAGAATTAPAARARDGDGRAPAARPVAVAVRGHARACTWIPAHRAVRTERVLLRAGRWREEVVPAVTRTVLDLSSWRLRRVVVTPARTRRSWVPPEWGERRVPVLVPGRWACSGHHGD